MRVYGIDRETYGIYLFENKRYDLAEKQFSKAISYYPDIYTQLMLGQSLLAQKKCERALEESSQIAKNYPSLTDVYLYLASTYGDCFNNKEKKDEFLLLYEKKLKEQQIPLKNL